jgi:hypothetical protein
MTNDADDGYQLHLLSRSAGEKHDHSPRPPLT